uniref:Capsid protein n=1 Tax=Apple picorna-like virus 1 TaxID=2709736 RepID=A0A6C0X234_9VIRU|nr:MAG: capsid protein [Apple picorna-like virus 1]
MSTPQSGLVPPVYPTIPQIPPPQTVTGLLSEDGTPSMFDRQMSGQPPNEDFWKAREEFITVFSFAESITETETLLVLDVLSGVDPVNNSNYYGEIQPPTALRPYTQFVPTCELSYPRYLLSKSYEFFEGPIKFKFWAVKPIGPKGKIRIIYLPAYEHGAVPLINANSPNVTAASDQRHLRNNMWEWDLEKQDSIEIEIFGNNPIGKIFNSKNGVGLDEYNTNNEIDTITGANEITNQGVPLFSRTYGTLLLQVQNRYIPGSIFANNCDVFVFKSMASSQFSLLRGPRTPYYNRVI